MFEEHSALVKAMRQTWRESEACAKDRIARGLLSHQELISAGEHVLWVRVSWGDNDRSAALKIVMFDRALRDQLTPGGWRSASSFSDDTASFTDQLSIAQ